MLKKIGRRILASREKAAKERGLNGRLSFLFTSRNLSFADACQIAISSVKDPRFEAFQIAEDKFWAPAAETGDVLTALFDLPHFDVRGDVVLWPVTSSCLFAFGSQSLLAIGTRMAEIETLSTLPPFPLLIDKDETKNWYPNDTRRGTSPIEFWIADLQRLYLQRIYTEQRDILNDAKLDEHYVVRYVTHTDYKKHLYSTAVIKEGVDKVSLPQADQVQFKDRAGDVVAEVTWNEFTSLSGEKLTEIGTYPARYQYSGFITDSQLRQTMRWRRKCAVRTCTCCALRATTEEVRPRPSGRAALSAYIASTSIEKIQFDPKPTQTLFIINA